MSNAYLIILIDYVSRNLFAYDVSKYCISARLASLRADKSPVSGAFGSVNHSESSLASKLSHFYFRVTSNNFRCLAQRRVFTSTGQQNWVEWVYQVLKAAATEKLEDVKQFMFLLRSRSKRDKGYLFEFV